MAASDGDDENSGIIDIDEIQAHGLFECIHPIHFSITDSVKASVRATLPNFELKESRLLG